MKVVFDYLFNTNRRILKFEGQGEFDRPSTFKEISKAENCILGDNAFPYGKAKTVLIDYEFYTIEPININHPCGGSFQALEVWGKF